MRAVALPWTADPAELLGVAWHYGVTHLVTEPGWAGLAELRKAHPGVLEPVNEELRVYRVRWKKVPPGGVRLPHGTGDARGPTSSRSRKR